MTEHFVKSNVLVYIYVNRLRLAGYGQSLSRRREKNWISDYDAAPPLGREVPDVFSYFLILV